MKYIIFLFFLFIYISCNNINNEMNILTDNNFSTYVTHTINRDNIKYLVVFYIDSCPYCKRSLKIINKEVIKNYENKENIFFGKVNCNHNTYLSIQFNITYIPYIVLFEKNKMFVYKGHLDKNNFIQFIDSEKYAEDGLNIPENLSNVQYFLRMFNEFSEYIKYKLQPYLDKRGIKIKWNKNYTIFMIFLFLVSILVFEYILINCLFNKYHKKANIKNKIADKNNKKTNANEKNKNNENNEKIKQDKSENKNKNKIKKE